MGQCENNRETPRRSLPVDGLGVRPVRKDARQVLKRQRPEKQALGLDYARVGPRPLLCHVVSVFVSDLMTWGRLEDLSKRGVAKASIF